MKGSPFVMQLEWDVEKQREQVAAYTYIKSYEGIVTS